MLTAFLLRGDNDPRRQMPEANSAFRLVDMLASGSTRAKRVHLAFAQQLFV